MEATPSKVYPHRQTGPSSILHPTSVPASVRGQVRSFYLSTYSHPRSKGESPKGQAAPPPSPPPLIIKSPFLPDSLVEKLLRCKRDVAIGTKYQPRRRLRGPPLQSCGDGEAGHPPPLPAFPRPITNMEASLHSLLTCFVPIHLFGDHSYGPNGHSMLTFPDHAETGSRKARRVILSTAIQLDFESHDVMMQLSSISETELLLGREDYPTFDPTSPGADGRRVDLDPESLEQEEERVKQYDHEVRRFAVHHLTRAKRLNLLEDYKIHTVLESVDLLERLILSPSSTFVNFDPSLIAIGTDGDGTDGSRRSGSGKKSRFHLSLELLINFMSLLLSNDLVGANACLGGEEVGGEETNLSSSSSSSSPPLSLIYTWNPASIFSRSLDATLVNRLMIFSLRNLLLSRLAYGSSSTSSSNHRDLFSRLSMLTFNDYADPRAVQLLTSFLSRSDSPTRHVVVLPQSSLYRVEPGHLDTNLEPVGRSVLLVHNNSDAFGQNIETEACTSLDGAIGCYSDAALSLRRTRPDLLDHVHLGPSLQDLQPHRL
ncbi:hypothetical protein IE53DRAFT_360701 [Violaceomyces palustris]|uniref:Uncharacterized protein n=1 Tax=Violaceomyces palustris TaxID=1673888 RepID=A0ACD0P342_9BASI|nr:hypothetical protein IE53DRAFT_360701 [Violaceomyces palustris]